MDELYGRKTPSMPEVATGLQDVCESLKIDNDQLHSEVKKLRRWKKEAMVILDRYTRIATKVQQVLESDVECGDCLVELFKKNVDQLLKERK